MAIYTNFFQQFLIVLSGLMNFSDIVIFSSKSNSCCRQNLKCFDMPLLASGNVRGFFCDQLANIGC